MKHTPPKNPSRQSSDSLESLLSRVRGNIKHIPDDRAQRMCREIEKRLQKSK
jgi:hypothetical protein